MISRIKAKKPKLPSNGKTKFKPFVIIEEGGKTASLPGPVVSIPALSEVTHKTKIVEKLIEVEEPKEPSVKPIEHSVVSDEKVAVTNYVSGRSVKPNEVKVERIAGDILKLTEKKMAAQISSNVWVVTSDVFDELQRLEKASSPNQTKRSLFGKDLRDDGTSLTVAQQLAIRIKNIETSYQQISQESQTEHLVRYRLRQEYGIGQLLTKNVSSDLVAVTTYTKVSSMRKHYHLVQEIGGDRRKRYIRVLSLFINSERSLARRIAQQERALVKAQYRGRSVREKLKIIRRKHVVKR